MTSKKNGEDKEKQAGLDLEAFELQIDREIDSLFIPGGLGQAAEEESSAAVFAGDEGAVGSHVAAPPAAPSLPVDEEPPAGSTLGIDIQAFETQIDQEIESLFVPLNYSAESVDQPSGVKATGAVVPEILDNEAPTLASVTVGTDEESEPQLELEGILESRTIELPKEEAPQQKVTELRLEIPEEEPPLSPQEQELPKLIEEFNVAYLSLDWEFSAENVSKCRHALEALQPYCQGSRETHFLFRILKTILHRLRMQPSSVQPQFIEILRDAQELIKPLLLARGGVSASEKDKLRSLIGRFQEVRERVLAKKEVRVEQPLFEQPVMESADVELGPRELTPEFPILATPSPTTLGEFREWLEAYRSDEMKALQALQEGSERLDQIGQLLAKAPALTSIASSLGEFRSYLSGYIQFSKEKQSGQLNQIQWLGNFEESFQAQGSGPSEEVVVVSCAVDEPPADVPKPVTEDVQPAASETRKDQVFIFSLSAKDFAVLASQVVKIERVSAKKAQKILSRGYATLQDFKPLFRNIKAGLFGSWSGLPEGILKTYRFVPLNHELFGVAEEPSSIGGAVLVSSGKKHGVIFTESAEVDLQNETEIMVGDLGDEGLLGTTQSDTGSTIEVLNVDRIMKKLR